MHQIDGNNIIFFPKLHFANHYHNFDASIIFQPELSNILYYLPGTKLYSRTICRNIWNKMIRNQLLIQAGKYIGKDFYNKYIIYVRRNVSMSRGGGENLIRTRATNYVFYLLIFYKYIHDYNKDINFLFYEMKNIEKNLLIIKEYNMNKFKQILLNLISQIQHENSISDEFQAYLLNLTISFEK